MCAIHGAYSLTQPINGQRLHDIVGAAVERGRDSAGIFFTDSTGTEQQYRRVAEETGQDVATEVAALTPHAAGVALGNNRATPTTEWVQGITPHQVQPYVGSDWVVVHNGTIANDKELAAGLGLPAPEIDSQVLPPLFDEHGFKGGLDRIVGSVAVAAYHRPSDTLGLAANYKPLYTALIDGVLYWASLPHHLPQHGLEATVRKLPPYSWATFTRGQTTPQDQGSFGVQEEDPQQRALVVLSGGLDSTVVAAAMLDAGHEVAALHVSYGARADTREVEAVQQITQHLGIELIHVTTDLFTETIRASRLTSTHEDTAGGEAGAELAHEWVPARNLIMASIATGIAEARGFGLVALGNNLEESGAYPDNEQEFIAQLNHVMPNAVNAGKIVRFVEPVGNLMKHEIVALGARVGAPFELSWSCYEGGSMHCGDCGPCFMRRTAFQMNDLTDPTHYQETTRVHDK